MTPVENLEELKLRVARLRAQVEQQELQVEGLTEHPDLAHKAADALEELSQELQLLLGAIDELAAKANVTPVRKAS